MPTYEYECNHCSARFELKQSFNDNSPVSCPHCGGKTRHIFSSVPIIFKGSGFYSTDNRGNHEHPAQESEPDEAKAGSDEAKAGSIDKDS